MIEGLIPSNQQREARELRSNSRHVKIINSTSTKDCQDRLSEVEDQLVQLRKEIIDLQVKYERIAHDFTRVRRELDEYKSITLLLEELTSSLMILLQLMFKVIVAKEQDTKVKKHLVDQERVKRSTMESQLLTMPGGPASMGGMKGLITFASIATRDRNDNSDE